MVAEPDLNNQYTEMCVCLGLQGEQLIEGVPSDRLNFVAAVWYAERCAVESEGTDAESRQDDEMRNDEHTSVC